MMNAISLFSGIGGMDIGFSAAGFNIIAQVEIDKYCRRVLKRHAPEWWKNAEQFTDVCEFGRNSVKGEIAVIFGGFPCQPHSVAGKRKGAMDSRNLWPEFRRIISEFRPRAVLLENVPGILSTGYAPTIIAELAQMGYVGSAGIISARDAGAPHRRERWWCVAYSDSKRWSSRQPDGVASSAKFNHRRRDTKELVYTKKVRSPKPFRGRIETSRWVNRSIQQTQYRRQIEPRLGRSNNGLPHWLDKPRWPAPQGIYQHDYEAPRTVQKKTIHDTNRIKALGNAVIPQISYALAIEIKKQL